MRFIRHLLIVISGLLVSPSLLVATELRYKEFTIKPKLAAGVAYDENFFKASANKRNVLTTYLKPGLQIRRTGGRSLIQLHYLLNATAYEDIGTVSDDTRSAESFDYIGHELAGRFRYKPSIRVTLGLDEGFFLTRDPAFSDELGDPTSREKYYINRLTPSFLYEFGPKLSAGFRYRNTVTDYLSGDVEDSVEHRGIFDLEYNLNRDTRMDFRYQLWSRDFNRSTSDYDSWETKLIFIKEFQKLSVEAGAGYQSRTFDGGSENTESSASDSLPDINNMVTHLAVLMEEIPWVNTPKTDIELRYDQNYNDQGYGNAYYLANRFTLSISRLVLDRVRTEIGSFYQRDDFENDDRFEFSGRTDNTYGVSGGIGYHFTRFLKGLKCNVQTGYERRNSNADGKDFENTFVLFDIRMGIESDLLTLRPSIR